MYDCFQKNHPGEPPDGIKTMGERLRNFGYEAYGDDNRYLRYKDLFHGLILLQDENGRIGVRVAVMAIFDRWANSGIERWFNTERDAVEYLCSSQCFNDAMSEFYSDLTDKMVRGDRYYTQLLRRFILAMKDWFGIEEEGWILNGRPEPI